MSGRNRDQKRKRKSKEINVPQGDRWLICCEGESEVYYLKALIKDLSGEKRHNINFGVRGQPCAGTMSGVCRQQGRKLYDSAQTCAYGKQYDKVWVVFDEDGESKCEAQVEKRKDFSDTIRDWSRIPENERLVEIVWSKPKFEYWLLLTRKDMTSGTPEKIEEEAKKILYGHYKVDPHRERISQNKRKLIGKPYEESYLVFGEQDGAVSAARRAESYYMRGNISSIEQRGAFKELSCGTNMHKLVHAIFNYFGATFE